MLDRLKDLIDPPLRDARIVYIHVPKCGGTSIRAALDGCFKPWRRTQRGSVLHLDERAARAATTMGRISYGGARRALLAYHLATTDARLVHGHYRYSRAVFERYRDTWSFITVLRHPVERWYSHYYFNVAHTTDNEYQITEKLEEHVQSERAQIAGTELVRSFADLDDLQDSRSDEAVERAIANLRALDIVGTLEDLPGLNEAFRARFDYPLDIPHFNVTPNVDRTPRAEVEPWIADRVREYCEPDLRLFRALFPEIAASRNAST